MKKIVKNIKSNDIIINKNLDSLINRIGPITERQLYKILGYKIDISSKNIINTKIEKWEDKNFNLNFKGINIYSYKEHSGQKIMHNILLIETYITLKNDIGGNIYNTFFDGEISFKINSSIFEYGNIFLKPDITIVRGSNIYCIEMDMGTESYDILKEKEFAYKKFIKLYGKYNIKIFFSSYEKRNKKLKEYNFFNGINIEYINIDKNLFFNNKKGEILI